MYSLTAGSYIDTLKTVDNMFIKQVYSLAVNSAKKNKMVSVVSKDFMSNRGEIAKRNKELDSKSIIDLAKLTPLSNTKLQTLEEEIALYRWGSLGFTEGGVDFWKSKTSILFLDYLLASSLCYVEVFEKGTSKVEKYYATRNRFIAGRVAGLESTETSKYINYLTPDFKDYKYGHIKILKLTQNKQGFRITQPRAALDLNKTVRITPLFLIGAFVGGLLPSLKENILKITYIKDNAQERELITTLSPTILRDYYDVDFIQKVLNNCEYKFNRGYIRLPELGCSKYDDTGVRALNLARITSIEVLEGIDGKYIDVDFSTILPSFKVVLNEITDSNILSMLYQGIVNEAPRSNNIVEMRADINSYVDNTYAISTTTFLRFLHDYMLMYKMIFKNYSGKPIEYGKNESSFNLGVIE